MYHRDLSLKHTFPVHLGKFVQELYPFKMQYKNQIQKKMIILLAT